MCMKWNYVTFELGIELHSISVLSKKIVIDGSVKMLSTIDVNTYLIMMPCSVELEQRSRFSTSNILCEAKQSY